MKLSQIDANLLVALDVLLEERHVTRAAARLGVTQSAMSQTLARLRDALSDPLLVRSGSKMVATPRAEALRAPLRSALGALERALVDDATFDPDSDRRFELSCLDVYAVSLVPRLIEELARAGERLSLDVRPLRVDSVWEDLRSGASELALVGPPEIPSDISHAPLLEERMLSLVRRGHPLLDGPITPERFTSWPHAVFSLTGRGEYPIDRALSELGVTRRVIGRTPYFLSAPSLVIESDVIVSVPRSAACAFARSWPVELFAPPFPPMTYWVRMAWPSYLDADPSHVWLRDQVARLGAQLGASSRACALAPGQARASHPGGCEGQ